MHMQYMYIYTCTYVYACVHLTIFVRRTSTRCVPSVPHTPDNDAYQILQSAVSRHSCCERVVYHNLG